MEDEDDKNNDHPDIIIVETNMDEKSNSEENNIGYYKLKRKIIRNLVIPETI